MSEYRNGIEFSKISWDLLRARKARTSLLDFTKYTFPNYQVNWHHKLMCDYLERWVDGNIRRLMLFLPPRSGKLCSDDTPVFTTLGWKTHGELKIGDYVFTESGNPTKVVSVSDPGFSDVNVVFENGVNVKVHRNHEWKVWDRKYSQWRISETNQLMVSGDLANGFEVPKSFAMDSDDNTNFIRDITYCKPELGRCIQVDSPDGIYLVTKSLIPTHNSELVSRRLPAWIFGKRPKSSIIASSYNMDLASKMNRDVQRIIDTDEYRKVFPGVGLTGRAIRTVTDGNPYLRNTEVFEIVNHGGIYKASGIGTGITGMGYNFGIIDDPVKDRKEAESKTIQNNVLDWYRSTFYTRRMDDHARILITLTRWSNQDLAGKLLELEKSDSSADKWTVLSLPMIAEDPISLGDPRKVGDPLWPERFSLESLLASRSIMGIYDWSALMQQNPIASSGTVFERGWFQFYDDEPKSIVSKMDEVVQVWDLAVKEKGDYNVGQVWGKRGIDKYLLGQYRGNDEFHETLKEFKKLCVEWPSARKKMVEDRANGPAIMSMLKHEIPGMVSLPPGGVSKEIRARAASPDVESGHVFVPNPSRHHWVDDLLLEVCDFPNGKHDDQTDCLSYAIIYFNRLNGIVGPSIPTKVASVENKDMSRVRVGFTPPSPIGGRRKRLTFDGISHVV